jgi:hypothetical protein
MIRAENESHVAVIKAGIRSVGALCRASLSSAASRVDRGVCCDLEKAQGKLNAARRQTKKVREHAAEQISTLVAVETKLGAAIVAALLKR